MGSKDRLYADIMAVHPEVTGSCNHGEANTKQIFAERIINEVDTERVGILGSGYFFRVNHEGLIKSLSTKFE